MRIYMDQQENYLACLYHTHLPQNESIYVNAKLDTQIVVTKAVIFQIHCLFNHWIELINKYFALEMLSTSAH